MPVTKILKEEKEAISIEYRIYIYMKIYKLNYKK